ncbi:MAG: FAD-dependent oxidoreductase [Ferrovum sp.]|nr:FAD-dependent oxidoreductase [Ferrovum sp.]
MRVLVLGAGILGVSTAWYLRTQGHEVTVIDRQASVARETSWANGGQLSTGHVEPWAQLSNLPKIIRWSFQDDAPLLFRGHWDWQQWVWALSFLRETTPQHLKDNLQHLLTLGRYSYQTQQTLDQELQLTYHRRHTGILQLYDNPKSYAQASQMAELITRSGWPRHAISEQEAHRLEPLLAEQDHPWVGFIHSPKDGSGAANIWTEQLAQQGQKQGIQFLMEHTIHSLQENAKNITGVNLQTPSQEMITLTADAYVIALGSYSTQILRPLGFRHPLYPVKGYSISIPIRASDRAPRISLTDDSHKIVITPLGDQLRVAGTAEFAGFDTCLNPPRTHALLRRVQELFPEAGDWEHTTAWTGLRPATPSNKPLIGPWKYPNLFLNTGHGTLGWTLGCGSSRALALLMDHKPNPIPYPFLTL